MDRFPPIPMIPHGSQVVWLKDDDSGSTTVPRNNPVSWLSNEMQAVALNEDKIAGSRQASGPSFFQLLENVSPHVQSVLLNKCTVLELSSLAVVSRSLRKGALETMAKRSLNIRIGSLQFCGRNDRKTTVTVMFIDDISDPSRNMSVEFCNCQSEEYKCYHWTKIQKLILFCGHASVKRINVETERFLDAVTSPNRFAMRSAHTSTSESPTEEFFVEEFTSDSCEGAEQLDFISPRILKLQIGFDYELSNNEPSPELHAVVHSRGILAAESICMLFDTDPRNFQGMNDELMLKLNASSIIFSTNHVYGYYWPQFNWTPLGVSRFIEQWLRGSRAIKKVTSGVDLRSSSLDKFRGKLVEALGKLEPAPQVVSSVKFEEGLKGQLQIMDGEMIYEGLYDFNRNKAAVIRVTAQDGREVTIAVTGAVDIVDDLDVMEFAFIDIFPSNQ